MLRVTVELFPHGQVKRGIILSQVFITNDGSGTPKLGNYNVTDCVHSVGVTGHARAKNVLSLVGKALTKLARTWE